MTVTVRIPVVPESAPSSVAAVNSNGTAALPVVPSDVTPRAQACLNFTPGEAQSGHTGPL